MLYIKILLYVLLFSLTSSFSIMLMGDRNLISGNLLEWNNFLRLIFHWKFILAMFLAVLSRGFYILVNNSILAVPNLASNSTTITAFVLLSSYVFIIGINYIFLDENLSKMQFLGAFVILVGVGIMLK